MNKTKIELKGKKEIHNSDIEAFQANRKTLDLEKNIVLQYYLETLDEPREGSVHL